MLNYWNESFYEDGHKYVMKCFRTLDGSVRRTYYIDGERTKRQIVINAFMRKQLDKNEKDDYNKQE